MKNNYMILGEIIKNRRIALGYSLRNLANEVGISHTELVRIENGNRQCLNTITLLKICKLLNLDFLTLLEDANFYEREEEKLFYIIVKNGETKVFKIHATSEQSALPIVIDFLSENGIIKIDEKINNTLIFATPDKKDNRIPCEITAVSGEEFEDNFEDDDFESEEYEDTDDFLGDIKIYFEINNFSGRKSNGHINNK